MHRLLLTFILNCRIKRQTANMSAVAF